MGDGGVGELSFAGRETIGSTNKMFISSLRALLALASMRVSASLRRFLAQRADAKAVHYAVPLTSGHIVEPTGEVTQVPPEYLAPWRQA